MAVVIFCLPVVNADLTPQSMNYASVVFAGFALISLAWYIARGRKDFKGPPVVQDPALEEVGVRKGSRGSGIEAKGNAAIESDGREIHEIDSERPAELSESAAKYR